MRRRRGKDAAGRSPSPGCHRAPRRAGGAVRAVARRRRVPAVAVDGEAGNTIAELLVATFLALLVLLVVFAAVRVQGRSVAQQTGAADAQQTTRGAGEILAGDLRMAGYGMLSVPPGSGPRPIEVTQSAGVVTIVLRGNFQDIATSLVAAAPAGTSILTVTRPAGSAAFRVGALALVDSGLAAEVRTITAVGASGGDVTLHLDAPLQSAHPLGPNVSQIDVVRYAWDGRILRRNDEVLADDTASFSLRYVDQSGTVADAPGASLRAVQIALVARQGARPIDAAAASSTLAAETQLRNLALRFDAS